MDQNGLQPRDLIPFIGSRNRVNKVQNSGRSQTLKMIWRRHEGLSVRRALENAGVEFIDENGGGPGVRLRKSARPKR